VTAVSLRSDISIAANLASLIDQRCTWRQAGQRNSASLRGMPAKVRMSTMWPVSTSTLLAGHLMTTLKSMCDSLGTFTQFANGIGMYFEERSLTLWSVPPPLDDRKRPKKFGKQALRRNNAATLQTSLGEAARAAETWAILRLDGATWRHRIRYHMRS